MRTAHFSAHGYGAMTGILVGHRVANDQTTAGAQRGKGFPQHLRLQIAREVMQHVAQQRAVARGKIRPLQNVALLETHLCIRPRRDLRHADFSCVEIHAANPSLWRRNRQPVRHQTVAAAEIKNLSARGRRFFHGAKQRVGFHFPIRELRDIRPLETVEPADGAARLRRRGIDDYWSARVNFASHRTDRGTRNNVASRL